MIYSNYEKFDVSNKYIPDELRKIMLTSVVNTGGDWLQPMPDFDQGHRNTARAKELKESLGINIETGFDENPQNWYNYCLVTTADGRRAIFTSSSQEPPKRWVMPERRAKR